MQVASENAGQGDFSLKRLQVLNWLLLGIITGASWLMFSAFAAKSVFVGGAVANISFMFLKKDLIKLLGGPLEAAKVRFFIQYYIRLSVVVIILFLLVKYQVVNTIGLLLGLSTVLMSICITAAGEVKKIYFNVKEAS